MIGSPARRRLLAAAGSATFGVVALPGCGSLTNTAPRFEFFMIDDLRDAVGAPVAGASSARLDRTLLLTTGPSPALYDSDRIVFTRDGSGHAYYQYSNWSERPARRVLALAEARLARGGGFRGVAQTLAGVRGDLVLSLRLDELLHDDAEPPGAVRVRVTAELVDWRTRTLAARRTFVQSAPVGTREARGAARAASVAVTALLDALVPWVELVAGAASPA